MASGRVEVLCGEKIALEVTMYKESESKYQVHTVIYTCIPTLYLTALNTICTQRIQFWLISH